MHLTPNAFQYSTNTITHKYNYSSILNHRLTHVIFTCQTCVQSDFTMVRFRSSAKIMLRTRSEPTISCYLEVLFSFLRHHNCYNFVFCADFCARKTQFSREKASKICYMGDLPLQFPSTDLHLEFGMGCCFSLNIPKN